MSQLSTEKLSIFTYFNCISNSFLLHFVTKFSSYPSPFAATSSINSALDFGILILDPSGGIRISSNFKLVGFGIVSRSNSLGCGISLNSICCCCCDNDDSVVVVTDGMANDGGTNCDDVDVALKVKNVVTFA